MCTTGKPSTSPKETNATRGREALHGSLQHRSGAGGRQRRLRDPSAVHRRPVLGGTMTFEDTSPSGAYVTFEGADFGGTVVTWDALTPPTTYD